MFYTQLQNRKLYFDGISSFDPNKVSMYQSRYKINWVDYTTPIIDQYNRLVSKDQQIQVKKECNKWDLSWNIPEHYQNLDVIEYVMDKHIEITEDMDNQEIISRDERLISELTLYNKFNKINILKATIYIVETLESHNITYGVGRGSSVSSYVLYVIGLHDVDSYAFDLDIADFFHD